MSACSFRHVAPFDDADFCGDEDYVMWFAPTMDETGGRNPDGLIECLTHDRCAVAKGACSTTAFFLPTVCGPVLAYVTGHSGEDMLPGVLRVSVTEACS